jgi:hypothetical protein
MSHIYCPYCSVELKIKLKLIPKQVIEPEKPRFELCKYCQYRIRNHEMCRYCRANKNMIETNAVVTFPNNWNNDRDSDTESFVYFRRKGKRIPEELRGKYAPERKNSKVMVEYETDYTDDSDWDKEDLKISQDYKNKVKKRIFIACEYCKTTKESRILCRFCDHDRACCDGEFGDPPDNFNDDHDSDNESFIYFKHERKLIPEELRGKYEPERRKKRMKLIHFGDSDEEDL